MPSPAFRRPPDSAGELRDPGVLVDVVVLSADLVLFDAIKAAIGERNPVWRARSAEESVDLLLTGRCGVLLLDMAAVSTQPTTLVEQISEQFPDIVVVVAGRREDEALLAQLISEGRVYRFMHKPLSAKRAGMFLQAAIRCHVERRESRTMQPLLPLSTVLPRRMDPGKWLFVAAGVALFVALIGLLVGDRVGPGAGTSASGTASRTSTPPDARPQADPVLSRARAAFDAGRYESPVGRNALDLFAAVLLAQPAQPEARAGLEKTVAKVALEARNAAGAGNRDEAERLLSRLQAVAPDDESTTRLARLLAPQPLPPAVPPPAPLPAEPRPTVASVATLQSVPITPTAEPVPARATRAVVDPVVRPDPLTARYSNAGDLRAKAAIAEQRLQGARIPGTPVPSLPTAGYVKDSRTQPVPSSEPAPAPARGSVGAFAVQADDMDRIYAADPVYPAAALRSGVEGWVELMFTITETGAVVDIEVVDARPSGVFEAAATEAVGHWRFRPRLANGQPVPRRSYVTLRFNVDG